MNEERKRKALEEINKLFSEENVLKLNDEVAKEQEELIVKYFGSYTKTS